MSLNPWMGVEPNRIGCTPVEEFWKTRTRSVRISSNLTKFPEPSVFSQMRSIASAAFTIAALAAHARAQEVIPFADSRWVFDGDSTRVERFEGRETLRMHTGEARLPNAQFQDGTIDVDVMTSRRRSFVYLNFRIQQEGEYEEFYLRPHKSTLPDAVQYAPSFQGQSAWQLYYGPRGTAAPQITADVWQHLRIVLSGRRAAFFLDDTVKPFMVVQHLARDPRPGDISLSSFIPPGTPGAGSAVRYANLRLTRNPAAYTFPNAAEAPLPAGTIREWEVGEAFAAPDSALSIISPDWVKKMSRLPVEPDGFVELHRHLTMPKVTRYVGAVARVRVIADRPGLRRLDLGFSDRVTVLLNGQAIFHRDDSYDYERRRDGLISFDQAAVYLPLRAGANDISFIVTDRFGGWGVMGRFPDMSGLRIAP